MGRGILFLLSFLFPCQGEPSESGESDHNRSSRSREERKMNHRILETSFVFLLLWNCCSSLFTLADLSSIQVATEKEKFNSLRSKPGYDLIINLRSNVGKDWRNSKALSLEEGPIRSWQIHMDSWELWLPP